MPLASTSCAPGASIDGSTAAITPSVTCTSAWRGPSGVWTLPPRMSSSVKFEVLNAEERRVRDAFLADVVFAALTAVQHHDKMNHIEARVAQHLDRAERVAAGRDHVLDHCDALARRDASLDLLRGAVALRLLADEEQRQSGLHRHSPAKQYGSELWRCEALRLFRHELSKMRAEALEQVGLGLEQEFVEVSIGLLAGAQDELALQVRGSDEVAPERFLPPNHGINLMDRSRPPYARRRRTRGAESLPRNVLAPEGSECGTGSRTADSRARPRRPAG